MASPSTSSNAEPNAEPNVGSHAEETAVPRTFILTLSCPQRPGIVHAVTAFLFGHGCDIVEHQQFDDPIRGALFLRTEVVSHNFR